jgi:hypothetical protein
VRKRRGKPAAARRRDAPPRPGEDAFQLSILGGAFERQFVRLRPHAARLPWGTLATASIPDALRAQAEQVWSEVTYSEHCAAAGMSTAVLAMVRACAPLDLVASASRFIFEELSHAELCARVTAELGGAPPLPYQAGQIHYALDGDASPIAAAGAQVIRVFCVNESLALPLVRAEIEAGCAHPLVDGLVRLIGREEGPHAAFGWVFLDWAAPYLDAADRAYLSAVAADAVESFGRMIEEAPDEDAPTLGWLSPAAFKAHGRRALRSEVIEPLRARGLLRVKPRSSRKAARRPIT